MDVQLLKEKLLEENRIADVLSSLGCHHIKQSSNMIQCANVDGDNPTAICVYLNENLTVINYTRQLLAGNQVRTTDMLDLVAYVNGTNFFNALKWVCDVCGYDYYEEQEELPDSLQILHMLTKMNKEFTNDIEDDVPVRPISNKILDYYIHAANKMWEDDGISAQTQREFNVMYDPCSNRVILPLFDSIGSLVGLKGRLMKKHIDTWEQKYIYMTRFNKSKYIFGLNKTIDMITRQGYCPIFEGEKSVMIAYEHGIGSVAVCGSRISRYQANLLTRLNVPLIICYDKDKVEEEVKKEADMFMEQVPLSYMLDTKGILGDKQSPVDNWANWEVLFKNNVYKIK